MDTALAIKRFDPEAENAKPYWQEFSLKLEQSATILDALIIIREEIDGSLALRCSCRSAICGSCAMRVNGKAVLACKTRIEDVSDKSRPISIEPAGIMPVIKDLVVDMDLFWNKVKEITPWLETEGVEPKEEYIASNDSMVNLASVMNCIMCGACVSDCTVLEVDSAFIGPAALAKAYRFVDDPRDSKNEERLEVLDQYSGIWDCTRCMECVEVCPKDVAPMDRIMELRETAIQAGFDKTTGAKHTEAFTKIIEHSGSLDELKLPIKTFGMLNMPLNMLPVGLRAAAKGKMPPVIHPSIPEVEKVKRIFDKFEEEEIENQEE